MTNERDPHPAHCIRQCVVITSWLKVVTSGVAEYVVNLDMSASSTQRVAWVYFGVVWYTFEYTATVRHLAIRNHRFQRNNEGVLDESGS
jgi:membrane protein YdbS with pleckstrin-like domain